MDWLVPWIISGLVLVGVALMVVTFHFYDVITKYEYDYFREDWEADGRPPGIWWIPPDNSWLWDRFRRDSQMRYLFWNTPDWLIDQPELRKSLRYYRIATIVGVVWWITLGLSANGIYHLLVWLLGETA